MLLGNEVPTTGDVSREGRVIHEDLAAVSPRVLAAIGMEVHGVGAVAMNDSSEAVYEKEVADGELRLEALQAQGTNPPPVVSSLVSELQDKIDTFVKVRDALKPCPNEVGVHKNAEKWMGQGPPSLENIPPMPTTNFQDLEGWLSDRNCDLRNAMEFGDSNLMAKIGLLVGQGATQLSHLGQDVSMQDHSKSSMMSSLIDAADAKRRCVAAGSACSPTQ